MYVLDVNVDVFVVGLLQCKLSVRRKRVTIHKKPANSDLINNYMVP